jgi:hypothetical protein
MTEEDSFPYPGSNLIRGAFVACGQVEMHRDGFRAQRTKIIALLLPQKQNRYLRCLTRIAAWYYRVPLFEETLSLELYAGRFGRVYPKQEISPRQLPPKTSEQAGFGYLSCTVDGEGRLWRYKGGEQEIVKANETDTVLSLAPPPICTPDDILVGVYCRGEARVSSHYAQVAETALMGIVLPSRLSFNYRSARRAAQIYDLPTYKDKRELDAANRGLHLEECRPTDLGEPRPYKSLLSSSVWMGLLFAACISLALAELSFLNPAIDWNWLLR